MSRAKRIIIETEGTFNLFGNERNVSFFLIGSEKLDWDANVFDDVEMVTIDPHSNKYAKKYHTTKDLGSCDLSMNPLLRVPHQTNFRGSRICFYNTVDDVEALGALKMFVPNYPKKMNLAAECFTTPAEHITYRNASEMSAPFIRFRFDDIETFDIVPMTFVHHQTKQTIPIGNYLPMYNFQVKKVFEM